MTGLLACFVYLVNRLKKISSTNSPRRACVRRINRNQSSASWSAQIEMLEQREMLSAASILSQLQVYPTYEIDHATANASAPYSPAQISSAYGFASISGNGSGQTIAIVDAYDDPTIRTDLQTFDQRFGLAAPASLQVVSQTGSTTNLPSTDSTKGWEVEESLDVEWAHALAPGAKIILVEANSASYSDLFTAVQTAAALPGVSVVSMSFGGDEFSSEASYNSVFTTPAGHQGVTFLASTGDSGAPGGFPAYSSNVVAVGGTSLTLDASGNYVSESGWAGSGGGISQYESQPSYQTGTVTQSTTKRTIPDVSFDADPNTGVYVCDSFSNGAGNPWEAVGGTSFACPAWASLISIVDQSRVSNGLSTLDGASQTLPMLYQLDHTHPSVFHDVTTGNNGNAAGTGYDLVTGLGSPVVNLLVPAMSGSSSTPAGNTTLAVQSAPATGTAGTTLGTIKIAVQNQNGQLATSDNSTVTLTLSSGEFSTGSATVTASVVNGIATFSNLKINTSGTYTLTASDSVSSSTATTSNLVISAGTIAGLSIQQSPTSGVAGQALSPVIKVAGVDQYGNVVSATSAVTLTLSSGTFSNKSTTAVAYMSGGVATFNNMVFSAAGNYTLKASTAAISSGPSINLSISPAAASKLVWQSSPESSVVAGTALNSISVLVEDAYGNVITSDNSSVTLTLSTGNFASGNSTVSANVVNGLATFSDLSIDAAGSYRISASDGEVTSPISSGSVVVSPAALSTLTILQNPTTGTAGMSMPTAVKVEALDQYGNLMTTNTTVTLSLSSGTFASGSASLTATTNHGIATFTGLILDVAGNSTLKATVGSVSSSSFGLAINPAAGKTPVWQTAPDSTLVAGSTLDPIAVNVLDAFGNLVTNTSPNVTLRLTGGKFVGGSTSVTVAAQNGIATFSNLAINAAGTYTLTASVGSTSITSSLVVSPSTAAQLAFRTAPQGSDVAGSTLNTITVAVEDSLGNVVTSDHSAVTLTLNGGTFSNGSATVTVNAVSGLATFSNLVVNASGTYTITASDGTSLSSATSGNLVVKPAALASLSIVQGATTGTAGSALSPAIKVAALDQYGNPISTSTAITLTLGSGNFSNRGTSVTAYTSSGIATFSNLVFNAAGNYTLTASTTSLSGGPSIHVAISPAAPSKLVWQTAPQTTAVAGTTLTTAVVAVEDYYGNIITTDNSQVTLTLAAGQFSSGSNSVSANVVNGVASFSGLSINSAGTYRISASDSEVNPILPSNSLVVSPDALSSLTIESNPTTGTAGVAMVTAVKVAAVDQFGNLLTSATTVTLTLSSGSFAGGGSTITAVTSHGIATFSGLKLNVSGDYTLTASVGKVSSSSFGLTISPAVGKTPVWSTAPDSTIAAGATLDPIVVNVQDAYGNLATSGTIYVTLKLTGGKFANGLSSVTVTAVDGVATFSDLSINATGSYSLAASLGTSTTTTKNLTVS